MKRPSNQWISKMRQRGNELMSQCLNESMNHFFFLAEQGWACSLLAASTPPSLGHWWNEWRWDLARSDRFTDSMNHWFTDSLIHWFVASLFPRLIHPLFHWFIDSVVYSVTCQWICSCSFTGISSTICIRWCTIWYSRCTLNFKPFIQEMWFP